MSCTLPSWNNLSPTENVPGARRRTVYSFTAVSLDRASGVRPCNNRSAESPWPGEGGAAASGLPEGWPGPLRDSGLLTHLPLTFPLSQYCSRSSLSLTDPTGYFPVLNRSLLAQRLRQNSVRSPHRHLGISMFTLGGPGKEEVPTFPFC